MFCAKPNLGESQNIIAQCNIYNCLCPKLEMCGVLNTMTMQTIPLF